VPVVEENRDEHLDRLRRKALSEVRVDVVRALEGVAGSELLLAESPGELEDLRKPAQCRRRKSPLPKLRRVDRGKAAQATVNSDLLTWSGRSCPLILRCRGDVEAQAKARSWEENGIAVQCFAEGGKSTGTVRGAERGERDVELGGGHVDAPR